MQLILDIVNSSQYKSDRYYTRVIVTKDYNGNDDQVRIRLGTIGENVSLVQKSHKILK